MLGKGRLGYHGNGMATFPICVPSKGCLKLWIGAEFLGLYAPVNVKPQGAPGDPGRFDGISFPVGEEWLKI